MYDQPAAAELPGRGVSIHPRPVFKDKQGMIVGYKVSGHAGYSEEGSDIICSAVSALTQAPLLGSYQAFHWQTLFQ